MADFDENLYWNGIKVEAPICDEKRLLGKVEEWINE